jgi:hypothetical protein
MVLLIITGLRGHAEAQPVTPDRGSATDRGSGQVTPGSPWLDLGAAPLLPDLGEPHARPRLAAGIMVGLYLNFTAWTYVAWYDHHKELAQYRFGGDGWLGDRTYAGGADKFGHVWATLGLARLGTEVLTQVGGYDRWRASLVATGLSGLLFLLVEVKDGFYYEFSFSDLTGDAIGAGLALAMSNWPRLDELVDFRVEYAPSAAYRRQLTHHGDLNVAEDYTGQTYLLAFHLGAIHALRDQPWGGWSRFVDVTAGFGSRGYKPYPLAGEPEPPHLQQVFLGVSLNAQGVFDWLLADVHSPRGRQLRAAAHAAFEMFNVPSTSLPVLESTHTATGPVMGGA